MLSLTSATFPAAWSYFDEDPAGTDAVARKAAALALARDTLGEGYDVATVSDADLEAALEIARRYVEDATGVPFVRIDAVLRVWSDGDERIFLPIPVVAESQGGRSIVAVRLGPASDDEEVSLDGAIVNEGAGIGSADPRFLPWIEAGPSAGRSRWPARRHLWIEGSFGFVEPDGTAPPLVRRALAILVPRALIDLGDEEAVEDLRVGDLIAESTIGRSYSLAERGVSRGVSGVREVDAILAAYRRTRVAVSRRRPYPFGRGLP